MRPLGCRLRVDRCADALRAGPRPLPDPGDRSSEPPGLLELRVPALQAEVRALAAERGAVILAHNYQLSEIQDIADYVGELSTSQQPAAATDAEVIAFCGVRFMAETASILRPTRPSLLPDLDTGCSLADSITADDLRASTEGLSTAVVSSLMVRGASSAEVKASTDHLLVIFLTRSEVVEASVYRLASLDGEESFGPVDMFLGADVEF